MTAFRSGANDGLGKTMQSLARYARWPLAGLVSEQHS